MRSGVGLQEHQSRALLQLGEQLQGDRVIGFEAGRQLVDQARPALDQGILVACEDFEFLHQRTIRFQRAQVYQIGASGFRQQIGVNRIGLGSRSTAPTIHCFRVDWIHSESCFQQGRNQQSLVGLNNTCHLIGGLGQGSQEAGQFGQALFGVHDAQCVGLASSFIDHDSVMMGVSPIDTCVPHARVSPARKRFLGHRVLISRCSQHDPLIVDSAQESCQGRTIFLKRSRRVEHVVFPRQFLWSKASPCKPFVEGA